jgi:hypothetical protein
MFKFELLTAGRGLTPVRVRCLKCDHQFTEWYDNLFTARDDDGRLTECPICSGMNNVEYPAERAAVQLHVAAGYVYLGDTLLGRNNLAGRKLAKRMLSNRGFDGLAIDRMLRAVRGAEMEATR